MTDDEQGALMFFRENAENIITPAELGRLACMSRGAVTWWLRRHADLRDSCVIINLETTTLIYWPAAREWLVEHGRPFHEIEVLRRRMGDRMVDHAGRKPKGS